MTLGDLECAPGHVAGIAGSLDSEQALVDRPNTRGVAGSHQGHSDGSPNPVQRGESLQVPLAGLLQPPRTFEQRRVDVPRFPLEILGPHLAQQTNPPGSHRKPDLRPIELPFEASQLDLGPGLGPRVL